MDFKRGLGTKRALEIGWPTSWKEYRIYEGEMGLNGAGLLEYVSFGDPLCGLAKINLGNKIIWRYRKGWDFDYNPSGYRKNFSSQWDYPEKSFKNIREFYYYISENVWPM